MTDPRKLARYALVVSSGGTGRALVRFGKYKQHVATYSGDNGRVSKRTSVTAKAGDAPARSRVSDA